MSKGKKTPKSKKKCREKKKERRKQRKNSLRDGKLRSRAQLAINTLIADFERQPRLHRNAE